MLEKNREIWEFNALSRKSWFLLNIKSFFYLEPNLQRWNNFIFCPYHIYERVTLNQFFNVFILKYTQKKKKKIYTCAFVVLSKFYQYNILFDFFFHWNGSSSFLLILKLVLQIFLFFHKIFNFQKNILGGIKNQLCSYWLPLPMSVQVPSCGSPPLI